MLKTLKWVYSLGVKQERVRIARHLENVMNSNRDYIGTSIEMLSDRDSNLSKRSKQSLEKKVSVKTEVNEIVQTILEPNYEQVTAHSILFPKGEK